MTFRLNNRGEQFHGIPLGRLPPGKTHADHMREVIPVWKVALDRVQAGEISGPSEAYEAAKLYLPVGSVASVAKLRLSEPCAPTPEAVAQRSPRRHVYLVRALLTVYLPAISKQQIWLIAFGLIALDLTLFMVPIVPFLVAYVLLARPRWFKDFIDDVYDRS